MSINFFETQCSSSSKDKLIGICDDPPPASNPAYLDLQHRNNWVGIVKNLQEKNFSFHAIDNCIEIIKPDGTTDSRCDGLLKINKDLVFVELKNRVSTGWLSKGRSQLTNTINIFKRNHDPNDFNSIKAYVSNKQRPYSNTIHFSEIQRFRIDTSLILRVQQEIEI